MKIRRFLIVALIFGLSGCEKKPEDNRLLSLDSKLSSLNKEVKNLKKKNDEQSTLLGFVIGRINRLDQKSATVPTDSKEYDIAKTPYGSFLVIVDRVDPYLDGFKVKMRVGNLSDATFTSGKMTILWGELGFEHEKSMQLAADVLPGRYTQVEAVLTPSKASEIKELHVSLEFGGAKLGVPVNSTN